MHILAFMSWPAVPTGSIRRIPTMAALYISSMPHFASFTNLYLSKKMLPENLKNKLIISGQDYHNADFIFNNNIFEINPEFDNKYFIPVEYKKYQSLKKGNILINEFYEKK